MPRYIVTGRNRVFGRAPGTAVHLDLSPEQEERMIDRGSLRLEDPPAATTKAPEAGKGAADAPTTEKEGA